MERARGPGRVAARLAEAEARRARAQADVDRYATEVARLQRILAWETATVGLSPLARQAAQRCLWPDNAWRRPMAEVVGVVVARIRTAPVEDLAAYRHVGRGTIAAWRAWAAQQAVVDVEG